MTHILALQTLKSEDDDLAGICFSIFASTIPGGAVVADGS